MSTAIKDRIEKHVVLEAPRARVWRALSDSREFEEWFQIRFTEPFRPRATVRGEITSPGYEDLLVEIRIDVMEPERRFAFRWHPNAVDPTRDFSTEPMTFVEFTLQDASGGTLLTLVESGFEGIPLERRAEALTSNDEGWTAQMAALEKHLLTHR